MCVNVGTMQPANHQAKGVAAIAKVLMRELAVGRWQNISQACAHVEHEFCVFVDALLTGQSGEITGAKQACWECERTAHRCMQTGEKGRATIATGPL
jgi:hypothetical protein